MDRIFLFALVGLIAGLLSSLLMKGGRFGTLGDTAMGVLGALGGGFLFRFILGDAWGLLGSMTAAGIGAALLIFDMRLMQKSIADRRSQMALWRRCTSLFRRSLAVPRQANGDIGICRVCGHRHLL